MHSMLPSWAVTSSRLPLSSRFHSTSEDCSSTWPVGSASFMWRQMVSAPLAFNINAQFISMGDATKKQSQFTVLLRLFFASQLLFTKPRHATLVTLQMRTFRGLDQRMVKQTSSGLNINLRTLKSLG